VLLRSYEPVLLDHENFKSSLTHKIMKANQDKVTISLAARATSAAPTFFPEVTFPAQQVFSKLSAEEKKKNLVFWDGGLLNNNPIDQLWYARYELVEHISPSPQISCVISLGTGYIQAESPASAWFHLTGVVSSVMDFTRHMDRLKFRPEHKKSQYVRLNPRLVANIGLADYTRMEELRKLTMDYIKEDGSQEWIDKAVCGICCGGCSKCEN
jgi:predicted acylesterase/phospholipase RssA